MLLNLFVSLFPLALYLFILAGINRRERPVVLHGIVEILGLFLALSGFLLFTVPRLLNHLYLGELNSLPLEDFGEDVFQTIWQRWFLLWICYYGGLAFLVPFLLLLRCNFRGIYNVDLEEFRTALYRTLEGANLVGQHRDNTLFLFRMTGDYDPATPPTTTPLAELSLHVFPAFCHVTLHWRHAPLDLRDTIDAILEKNLEDAVARDNPAANWFLGFASLLFGVLFMIVAMLAFARFFPRRNF